MASPWMMTLTVQGSDFVARAAPIAAHVGTVPVEFTMINEDGTEFYGILGAVPQAGEELTVGYLDAPQMQTGIFFNPGDVIALPAAVV